MSKAAAESSQVQRALEEHIEIFERKKILDIKTILMEFVMSELRFHAEALEVYTEAYRSLMEINVDSDFQVLHCLKLIVPQETEMKNTKNCNYSL